MKQDDILKAKAVLLYIVDQCGGLDFFRIFKILYFANREHLATYGRPIVTDTFCALRNGPVPSTIYDAIKIAQGRNKILNTDAAIIAQSLLVESDGCAVYAKEKPNLEMLSKSDTECILNSIAQNKDRRFKDLSDASHDEAYNHATSIRENSPMDILEIAKAGGANEAMLDYIKEHMDINAAIC